MTNNICENVCNILKNQSDLISQQKKDLLKEIKGGHCGQSMINRSIELNSNVDTIANLVINLDRKNVCKCNF